MNEEKEKILNFALEKFLSEGFYKTSMDDVASGIHVSKKTIYKHFPSKRELVKEVSQSLVSKNHSIILEKVYSGENSVEKLFNIMQHVGKILMKVSPQMLHDLQMHFPNIWKQIDEFRTKKMSAFLREIFEQGKKEKNFINENTDLLVTVFISSVRGVVNPEFAALNKVSMQAALEATIEILLNGILTNKGKKIFNKLKDGAGK